MKKIFLFAAILAGVASLASCNKEQNPQTEEGKVTITVSFPEVVESKVAMEEGQEALDLQWEADDMIFVIGNTTEKFTFVDRSADGKTATFTGNVVTGEKFDVIISDKANYSIRNVIYDYKQTANGSTDHVIYEAVLKGVDTYENVSFTNEWAEGHGGTFDQSGCVQFNIQIPQGCTQVNSVKILASDRVFNSTHTGKEEKVFTLSHSVNFTLPAEGEVLTMYWMTSMVADVLEAGSQLSVLLEGKDYTYIKDIDINKESKILPGKRNIFTVNGANWIKTQIKYANLAGLRETWKAPYTNFSDVNKGPGHLVDGTTNDWAPSNSSNPYIIDTTYDAWDYIYSANERFRTPLVAIINLQKAEYLQHMWIKVGDPDDTKRVEVYLSNDESNDADFGEHLNQNLMTNLTSDMVEGDWAKWEQKKWMKYLDQNMSQQGYDIYNGHFKTKYIMIVIHGAGSYPWPSMKEINPKVYARVD